MFRMHMCMYSWLWLYNTPSCLVAFLALWQNLSICLTIHFLSFSFGGTTKSILWQVFFFFSTSGLYWVILQNRRVFFGPHFFRTESGFAYTYYQDGQILISCTIPSESLFPLIHLYYFCASLPHSFHKSFHLCRLIIYTCYSIKYYQFLLCNNWSFLYITRFFESLHLQFSILVGLLRPYFLDMKILSMPYLDCKVLCIFSLLVIWSISLSSSLFRIVQSIFQAKIHRFLFLWWN